MRVTFTFLLVALMAGVSTGQDNVRSVHYLDEQFISRAVNAYYLGCQELISDTSYKLKYELRNEAECKVYFDTSFHILQGHYYTRNDTSFSIMYHINGRKQEENREVLYLWVYSASWCENGQLISERNPNDLSYRLKETFYCNGNRKWQGAQANGHDYGVVRSWYPNGELQSEKNYTKYDPDSISESRLISEQYWDEFGNEVSSLSINKIRKNTLNAPIRIAPDLLIGLTPYYEIKGQAEYDNQMTMLQAEVYKIAELDVTCHCDAGLVYVSFTVTKEGVIKDVEVTQSLEPAADVAFVETVKKLRKWTPGFKEGEPVDVKVEVALELERIK